MAKKMISFLNAHGAVTTVSEEDWENRFANDVANVKLTEKQCAEYGKLARAVSEAEFARRDAERPADVEAAAAALHKARTAFDKFVASLQKKD